MFSASSEQAGSWFSVLYLEIPTMIAIFKEPPELLEWWIL
jgi:hypothetical protein